MKKINFILGLLMAPLPVMAQQDVNWGKPEIIQGVLLRETGPLRDHAADPGWVDVKVRDERGIIRPEGMYKKPYQPELFLEGSIMEDGAVQRAHAARNAPERPLQSQEQSHQY